MVISKRAGADVLGCPVLFVYLGLVLLCVALWRARFAPAWLPVVPIAGFSVAPPAPEPVVAEAQPLAR